uniref:Uncharacterized protein n=1 Tax=Siphoviridae sp. ctRuT6 TaxID=2826339 RepID=A0A8S5N3E1_9CAUD|nr:MAG TPA: hypothetical protein [Siphoviridae sp. ctRuT6]
MRSRPYWLLPSFIIKSAPIIKSVKILLIKRRFL